MLGSGAGFTRCREDAYLPGRNDVYVNRQLIDKYGLRTGDTITGTLGKPGKRGKSPRLTKLEAVNGRPPEDMIGRSQFGRLRAVHPDEQLVLDCGLVRGGRPDYTNRIIDLFCPFGKGQRSLIVAPAKAGKTMVLQSIAAGVVKNYPDCTLLILLVDERPEEVTEMEVCELGEVVSSSFDHSAERHVGVAEMTLERARRRVELGEDVVVILDSITRLARAYNTVEEGSGRTLTGGIDATSLEKPKRFLGSARKIDSGQGGGSLTIVGTALVDTGSRMDQVIFEEFKGTGNSELVLSRELAERRVFPAIDLTASATRREELLLNEATLEATQGIRRTLAGMSPLDAIPALLSFLEDMESSRPLPG